MTCWKPIKKPTAEHIGRLVKYRNGDIETIARLGSIELPNFAWSVDKSFIAYVDKGVWLVEGVDDDPENDLRARLTGQYEVPDYDVDPIIAAVREHDREQAKKGARRG